MPQRRAYRPRRRRAQNKLIRVTGLGRPTWNHPFFFGHKAAAGRRWKGAVGNKKIRNLKKTQMGRIGLSAALALKTLKKHEPPVVTINDWKTEWTGSDGAARKAAARPGDLQSSPPVRAHVVWPFYLTKSATRSETQRECDNIYMFNCRGQFEICPQDHQLHPIILRVVQGYAIGVPDANVGTGPTQAKTPWDLAQASSLSYYLQTPECKLDPDYYNIHYDKEFTISPRQVYYNGTDNKAIWKNKRVNFNMKFDKKVLFDGGQPTDSVGKIPFVAILHYTMLDATDTTGSSGTHEAPKIRLDTHSYFKDC